MTTVLECVVTTPPPYSGTFSPGPAVNGSCASYASQYPGDTVTATSVTVGGSPLPTTTTTNPTCYVGCTPGGYAGISGSGENCGAGPTGSCTSASPTLPPGFLGQQAASTTTTIASTHVATPLAFTGADLDMTGGLGLAAVAIGVLLVYRFRTGRARN